MPTHFFLLLGLLYCASSACTGGAPNGIIEGTEECDDGNDLAFPDGCTNCKVDAGYVCWLDASLTKSICTHICGDGLKIPGLEQCDDGNTIPGDGCTDCLVDTKWNCYDVPGSPYPKSRCFEKCPQCSAGYYLISPCTETESVPVRCVPCKICTDRQTQTSPCTNDQDRVCQCLPGTSLTPDGQCLRITELPPTCDWQAWGPWGSCGLCGGVRTRSRAAGPAASPACPPTYLESEVCSTECTGLPYDQEKEIEEKYNSGTPGYGSLSLYAFWSGEGAKFILGKYELGLALSPDPEGDALDGRFQLFLQTPAIANATNASACDPSLPSVQEAYQEVHSLTSKFLIERRGIDANLIKHSLVGCDIEVKIDSPTSNTWLIGVIVGPVCATLLLLILVYVYWSRTRPLNLKPLPPAVRWQYEQYQSSPGQWKQMGHGTGSFYQKKLDFNSEEFEKLGKIFFDYQGASSDFPISEAYAVYNPLLISNFINQLQILRTRFQKHPDLFKTSQWMLGEESDAKMKINDCYTSRSKALPYNDSDDVVILPTVHGTDFSVARSICSTGFAALSLLDGGWYGRGIYFSTYAMYTAPYFENRREPALVISYVISGHSFPVSEDHTSSSSLLGSAIKSGYTSHYVVVKENGRLPSFNELKDKSISLYDEIVIPQESQIMPVYVLKLDMNQQGGSPLRSARSSSKKRRSKKAATRKTKEFSPRSTSNDVV